MKNIYTKSILALLIVFSFSCEDLNEDINANPNDILTTDVEDKLFLTGAQLANIQIQLGQIQSDSIFWIFNPNSSIDNKHAYFTPSTE